MKRRTVAVTRTTEMETEEEVEVEEEVVEGCLGRKCSVET